MGHQHNIILIRFADSTIRISSFWEVTAVSYNNSIM